ncbi:hypothetical protein GIB67_037292 [Kingdonia uniflora]|uniref:Uncharacterized protein n=1 Tax=Kingdonia uniflora TaxID=39325 RepID=A0A7J7MRZ9_9MAGN|nr:hypothetical protein GIB67_037292 [Kingdonia uniflora]
MKSHYLRIELCGNGENWFWYGFFADEVLKVNHRRDVLRYTTEDEIRQEDILTVGGLLIPCGQVKMAEPVQNVNCPDAGAEGIFDNLNDVEPLIINVTTCTQELGRNCRVGDNNVDIAHENRYRLETGAIKFYDGERIMTDAEHEPQASDQEGCAGGDGEGDNLEGSKVLTINWNMSAKNKRAADADASLPLENPSLSGYTTESTTTEKEALLSEISHFDSNANQEAVVRWYASTTGWPVLPMSSLLPKNLRRSFWSMEAEKNKALAEAVMKLELSEIDSLKRMNESFAGQFDIMEEKKYFYKGLAYATGATFVDFDAEKEVFEAQDLTPALPMGIV